MIGYLLKNMCCFKTISGKDELFVMKPYFCNQKKSYISFTWKQARTRKTP
ncbi:hypothetical protein SAMN06265346_1244 [Flavobacterium hercynium]|nr:hypothetical protein SAMN06265346_1244 [Flavobacterium hercynium]